MIEEIIKVWKSTDWDYRDYYDERDPNSGRRDLLVDYYQMKYAVAHVLRPRAILEEGVRAGYSAIAFLNGTVDSTDLVYRGWDNNTDWHGGYVGAIDHARKILEPYDAQIMVCDSKLQTCTPLPGGFDMMHIDGCQDHEGTRHNLDLGLRCNIKWLVVDGMYWTEANLGACHKWLKDNIKSIEWYGVIPGMAGELIIKTHD